MKQYTKTLLALICVMALTAVFTGCPDGGGGGGKDKTPPTNIVVKDSNGASINFLTLALADTENLTVSADGATEYWWEISGGTDVELSNEDGETTTVTAKKIGTTTKIKVYAGNKDGSISKEIPVTVLTEVPQLQIAKVMADNNEILTTDKITIPAGASATLTFEVKDSNGAAVTGATITVTSNVTNIASISTTSGIQVNGIAAGEATITITAEKQGYKKSDSVTREVKVNSSDTPMLTLSVGSGGTGAWAGDTLTIKDNDTLTLTATGTVSGTAVNLTSVDWEVTGTAGIVTVANTTGVVTVIKPGTTQIKVTAQAAEAEDPEMKTITLVVQRNYEKVLFEWNKEDNPLPASGPTSLTSSGHGYTHPGSNQFKQQTNGLRVSMMRTFGAGVNVDGEIRLSNSPRLAIGQTANTQTANTNTWETDLGGQIDLYRKKVKLTIGYKNAEVEANRYALRVYVNNNGTGGTASMFGGNEPYPCVLYTWPTVQSLIDAKAGNTSNAGTVTLEIDTTKAGSQAGGALYEHTNEYGLATAFITLHNQAQTAGNGITITDILLEWVEGTAAPPPVLPLTVTADNEAVPAAIPVKLNDTVALSATTDPTGAAITWTIGGTNTDAVTLSANTTGSTTLTAVKEGTATITVKAVLAGYRDAIQTFTVNVGLATGTIFEWNSTDSGQAWTELNTGAGNSKVLGTGKTSATVRVYGTRAFPATSGGILLGGRNMTAVAGDPSTSAGPRIAIGQSTMQASANADAATLDYNGQFNLYNRKIKITISYKDANNNGYSRDTLWVTVNNNGTSANASSLGTPSQYVRYASSAALVSASETGSTAASGTVIIQADFTTADFLNKECMKKAFIGLYTLHDNVASGAGNGNWLTITAVKIEYND